MSEIKLRERYPLSRPEDVTDAYMRGFQASITIMCDPLRAENDALRKELEMEREDNESMRALFDAVAPRCGKPDCPSLVEYVEKLRELCATVIDDWMSKVCPTFPFCSCDGEYERCTDEACGNQIYRQQARELGIEVTP